MPIEAFQQSPEGEPPAGEPSSRPFISLLLFIHLFCVFVAMSSNLSRSGLQDRLLRVLSPYTQLLGFDLNYTPYHFTHNLPLDVDHRVELLAAGRDAADPARHPIGPSLPSVRQGHAGIA